MNNRIRKINNKSEENMENQYIEIERKHERIINIAIEKMKES